MQALGPPDKSPLQGLVASRIETYGGRYRASVSSPPGNVYPQGGLLLVSPGCAPEVIWAGQAGGHPGFQVSVPLPGLGWHSSQPTSPPSLLDCEGEDGCVGPGSQDSTLTPDRRSR